MNGLCAFGIWGSLLIKSLFTQPEKASRQCRWAASHDLHILMLCDGNELNFLEIPVAQSSRNLSHACMEAVHSPMLAVQSCNMHTADSPSALGVYQISNGMHEKGTPPAG